MFSQENAYQSTKRVFPSWKCPNFETFKFLFHMVLKVTQTKLLKIFIFSKKCLSVPKTQFLQAKNPQNCETFKFLFEYGLKSFPKRNFIVFRPKRSDRHSVSKKIFKLLKICILSAKCLSVAKTKFLQPENSQNLKLLNFCWIWS